METKKETIKELACNRCEHRWLPRAFKLPDRCPKCNSPYWNKPRVRKIKERKYNGR